MSYAIIEIADKQFKVSPSQYVYVPKMSGNEGEAIIVDKTLLLANEDETVLVGTPHLEGIRVKGKILGHVKDDKVIVFKKKRRKGYAVKRGHRQQYTKILIESISQSSVKS